MVPTFGMKVGLPDTLILGPFPQRRYVPRRPEDYIRITSLMMTMMC
jgi:hypothetical protein